MSLTSTGAIIVPPLFEICTVKRSVTTVVYAPLMFDSSITGVETSVNVFSATGTSAANGTSFSADGVSIPTIAVCVTIFPFSSIDCVSSHLSQRRKIVKKIAMKRNNF